MEAGQSTELRQDWNWQEARRICMQVARRYACSGTEADDIAQDALLRAWRRRATLRSWDRRSEWLAAIARNEAIRRRSIAEPEQISRLDFVAAAEDKGMLSFVELADLRSAMRRLDRRDRVLLRLRYQEDLTHAAIARLLEIPEGTVKVRLHRARNKIRRAIEKK